MRVEHNQRITKWLYSILIEKKEGTTSEELKSLLNKISNFKDVIPGFLAADPSADVLDGLVGSGLTYSLQDMRDLIGTSN